MGNTLSGRPTLPRRLAACSRAAALALLLTLGLGATAPAQQLRVSGTVSSPATGPMRGVTVRVQGTDSLAVTNANGRYAITAPASGTLTFTLIGFRPADVPVNGRTTVDVTMDRIAILEQMVVTGYSGAQRRAEITGAVASVDMEAVSRQTSASVLQRLDASTSGVTVASNGSPGSRSTVRIRGISSFQNNDPLYIVDGTPVQDSYINWLNPSDIESIQVLKDASSASIYGSRASNGVIIIETTKRGASGAPRARLSLQTGVATPVRGYDDFLILNSLDYFEIVKRSYVNAGYSLQDFQKSVYGRNLYGDPNNPTVPQYIFCAGNASCTNVDPSTYSYPNGLIMPGSAGTNWWKQVFGQGKQADLNLGVTGGGTGHTYAVGFNYFDQYGTAKYSHYQRGSIRVNTSFNRQRLTVGENIALSGDRSMGGLGNDAYGEGGFLGKNILSQPVVPVRDVAGNFASGKGTGLGNNTNPLKEATRALDNISRNGRVFGNVFGGFDVTPQVNVRSTFGFNLGLGAFNGYTPMYPENSEPNFSTRIDENTNYFTSWTWTNTATYKVQYGSHNLTLLGGQEATRSGSRSISGSLNNLISTDPNARFIQDALGDATTKNVSSGGGRSALLSYFGKADYNLLDRYLLSFTLRKDGSSTLGPANRWGTFPAFGAGWRISEEPFLKGNRTLSDLRLRFAWGVTGNQQIPTGRIVSAFGGSNGDTYYDIGGTNTSVQAGYRQTSLGNPDLKWEENRSTNYGVDVGLFDGMFDVVADIWERRTNNLLYNPAQPATAGIASPPVLNVGKMSNKGYDFSIGHRAQAWSLTFNGSHYTNKILSIDGVQDFFFGPGGLRINSPIINQVGQPIGAFYGLVAEGFFKDAADVAAHAQQNGAAPGRLKFKDVNGDGKVTLADRTIIGSPHPKFTGGLDFTARRGAIDLAATVFGSFGNKIFEAQKDFYVFRDFSTNVRKDLLTDSWTPDHTNAKYPKLDINDTYSRQTSSYYIEDGSYVRLRNVQIGYNVPDSFTRWLNAARVYVQMENLWTITGYPGLDPALGVRATSGALGDIRDQYRGVDQGTYPANKMFSIGLTTNF